MNKNTIPDIHVSIPESIILFLENKKDFYSVKTIETYRHHLKEFSYSLKDKSIDQLKQEDIDNFLAYVRSKKYCSSTISNYLYAIKGFFKFYNLNYSINFYHSDYKKDKDLKSNIIPKDEYSNILNSIYKKSLISENEFSLEMSLRDLIIVQLLIETGMKTSELVLSKLGDIDYENRVLKIKETNRPERKIKIKPETIQLIKSFLERRKLLHNVTKESSLIISFGRKDGLTGSKITTRTLQRILTYHSDAKYRPKDFRHTFVLIQLLSNSGLYTTSDLLGGISDDTKTYYRNLIKEYGGKIEMCEEDYNAYEYLRHKYGKSKLVEIIEKKQ